jgi:hypothetical protein
LVQATNNDELDDDDADDDAEKIVFILSLLLLLFDFCGGCEDVVALKKKSKTLQKHFKRTHLIIIYMDTTYFSTGSY